MFAATLMSWIRRPQARCDSATHRIAHNDPLKKQKGDVSSPFPEPKPDTAAASGGGFRYAVAPFV
jgi:hypothetical protein